jgi:fatty-acyl-CoA synthase
MFVDRSLIALLWPLADSLKTVRQFIVMDDGAGAIPDDPRIVM